VEPYSYPYVRGESVSVRVNFFNLYNPNLDYNLTFPIIGPEGYYLYDVWPIKVAANQTKEFDFGWTIPDLAGTYMV
jgi:hypothetical protein